MHWFQHINPGTSLRRIGSYGTRSVGTYLRFILEFSAMSPAIHLLTGIDSKAVLMKVVLEERYLMLSPVTIAGVMVAGGWGREVDWS